MIKKIKPQNSTLELLNGMEDLVEIFNSFFFSFSLQLDLNQGSAFQIRIQIQESRVNAEPGGSPSNTQHGKTDNFWFLINMCCGSGCESLRIDLALSEQGNLPRLTNKPEFKPFKRL
jgi:hypothetical protein